MDAVLRFNLNPGSGVPIYRQLVEQVQRMVAAGQLRPGDELPSVRELAVAHAVNPMTISRAYSLLEAEGILRRRRGKPMEVAVGAVTTQSAPVEVLAEPLAQLVSAARQLGLNDRAIKLLVNDYLAAIHKESESD